MLVQHFKFQLELLNFNLETNIVINWRFQNEQELYVLIYKTDVI